MLMRLVIKALGVLYDLIEPIAGTCPVCAFLRGLAAGLLTAVFFLVR